MPLTKKQQEYLRNCNHRWNVKTGATGSGKSFVDIAVTIPQRIFSAKGEGLLVLLGNTKGTLERNILDPMREIWTPDLVGNISSDNTVKLFGKKVYALGADNKKHMARIQGATFEYVYGDEVTTWAEEVFQMLKSRLRCEHSHFDGTCNPDNPKHWFKAFLDSGDVDIYHQSYVIDDGALPPKVVEELKKEYAGTVYYNRFILGQWAPAEGLVYAFFRPDIDPVPTAALPSRGIWYISIDYGTANPCSMGLWCVADGKAYREDEYYFDSRKARRQHTDEEYYKALENLAGDREIEAVIVDPSAASFIETIRRHERFVVYKAKNDVLDGIRVTASLLRAGRVLIGDRCQALIGEMQAYSWDDKASGDAVIKEFDHACDDMRYFCNTILRREFRWESWGVRGDN